MKPTILHLNSYFFTNSIHLNMVNSIYNSGFNQLIFTPLKKGAANNETIKVSDTKLYITECFSEIDRYLWPLKMFKIYRSFDRTIKLNGSENIVIHAHSLFVNGLLAVILFYKYKFPFIVTVRNTDINTFFKRWFFRKLGHFILKRSNNIITLNEKYFNYQLKKYCNNKQYEEYSKKHLVIPNGANEFWFKNLSKGNRKLNEQITILFIGTVDSNKNIESVLIICERAVNNGFKLHLNIVGDGEKLNNLKTRQYSYSINYYGYLKTKEQLLKIINESDVLIVPSFTESFGIVYVEAMTQGLPVIYSKNQGFDGFAADGIYGYSVNPYDLEDIYQKLCMIIENYEFLSANAIEHSKRFTWSNSLEHLIKNYHILTHK